ncbi:MAG: radical SAM protein, partial [Clostridia bacterium]|nr:radical SAM protein [Clostridia bacterium]
MDISYEKCNICPRSCGVDRVRGELGYCASPSVPHVVRVAPHMWEEPIISGTRGSGTVFFSGCSLRCSYCQNYEISRSPVGEPMTDAHLAKKMLDLERAGVHNINFVTPTHFAPS